MITEEKYTEAKIMFMHYKNVLQKYKAQPKEKRNPGRLKRKPFTEIEIKKGIENIFNKKKNFRYTEIVIEIKLEFKTGECFAKSLLTEFQNKGLISKSISKRYYETSRTN